MLDSLKAGGILMLPIILCGVIATFIIITILSYYVPWKKTKFTNICATSCTRNKKIGNMLIKYKINQIKLDNYV